MVEVVMTADEFARLPALAEALGDLVDQLGPDLTAPSAAGQPARPARPEFGHSTDAACSRNVPIWNR